MLPAGGAALIIFADEIIGLIKRYLQGFALDTEHFALDVIKAVGPGGHFLGEKHTLDFFMQEHWRPTLFNRRNLPNWIRDGKKTIIFDGGMGTLLMASELAAFRTPVQLNAEKPAVVMDIHQRDFAAGADVVITNTFGGNPLKLAADGPAEQFETLNREGVKLAKQACPNGKFVAGAIGPCGKMLKPLGDLSLEEMQTNFHSQARVLIEGGVDLLIIETMYSLEEALAALYGVRKAGADCLLVSMTSTQTKNGYFTMMGENIAQCASALEAAGADMIGGCCGTSPEFIQALRAMVSGS